MDYSVRQYQPGDEEGIVQLLELVFDGWPHFDLGCTPLEHWRWKYLENPLKMNAIAVALNNENIIGCIHGYYLRMKVGNELFIAQHGGDLAVHQDFRRRGISGRMRELKHEIQDEIGTDIRYSVSGNPIVIERSKRRGRPIFPHPVHQMVWIDNVDLHLKTKTTDKKFIHKYGYHTMSALNKIKYIFKKHDVSEYPVKQIKQFDERIDDFWDNVKGNYSFIVERNKDYLNWRYCTPNGGNYHTSSVEDDGLILGFIVLRINKYEKEYPRGYIVDLLALPDRIDVANSLVITAMQYFRNENVNHVSTWVIANHPYEHVLRQNGFVDSRSDLYLKYELKKDNIPRNQLRLVGVSSLHFQIGDTDHI